MTKELAKLKFGVVTIFLIHFVFSILIASGQGVEEKKPEISELAKTAEAYFQEAILLSSNKERALRRHRLMEARRLWIQIHDLEKAARACIQIGDIYKHNKEYQESLYYYGLALEGNTSLHLVNATAFISIAQIYADIYQAELAFSYYDRAISQAQAAKDLSAQLVALSGLAGLYHQQEERERAIACIVQAQQLNQRQQNESIEAELLHLTGIINQEKGMVEQARATFGAAIKIYQKLGDEEGYIKALCSLSNCCLVSSQKQEALEAGEQAVNLAEKRAKQALTNADIIRARDLRWRAWLSQARAQRAVGQKELAVKSFRWAIHQLEGLYWSFYVTTEASAAEFREACQIPYIELADLLVEQREFEQAYTCAQQAKARTMMGLIEARRTIDLPKDPKQEETIREITRIIAPLRIQLLSSQLNLQQQMKIQKYIKDLEYKIRETRLKFEMERSRYQMRWSARPSIKQLQAQIAQEKSAILEFFLGETRSFVWLISSNNTSLGILPGRKEIEKSVNQYLKLINTSPDNLYVERDISKLKEQGEKLFPMLFGQLSEQIASGQKLIIVPDGLLHYLPFEALVSRGRYMIEDHEIRYVPSVNLLVSEQSSKGKIEPEDKMEFLAFGDPNFGAIKKPLHGKETASLNIKPRQQDQMPAGFQLSSLPRTRDEVLHIAGLFPAGKTRVYLGKESTERAVKQENLSMYRRLHFATHSLIDERSPYRSAVMLTLNDDPEEDGFLEVGEITELELDSDLVVLSACQTGQGQLLSGEGLVGLSRAFLYAGARSVIVSLWDVPDISTNQLMKGFYQRLVNNTSNTAALHDAKLHMVKSSKWTRHPYFWAPFIVVGKP